MAAVGGVGADGGTTAGATTGGGRERRGDRAGDIRPRSAAPLDGNTDAAVAAAAAASDAAAAAAAAATAAAAPGGGLTILVRPPPVAAGAVEATAAGGCTERLVGEAGKGLPTVNSVGKGSEARGRRSSAAPKALRAR
mmetsp:Transcript_77354/g.201353  ORF Transcript_77354/g.201353 Transcript_77354/m.201353 type:complete len:138 (+) Transcript_77354:521-934(+)